MRLKGEHLKPAKPIYGFFNQPINFLGQVTLPVTLGHDDHNLTLFTCFLVVNLTSTHIAIFGRSLMKEAQLVTTVYCLIVKFSTSIGIGYTRDDRTKARKYHLNSLRIVESL